MDKGKEAAAIHAAMCTDPRQGYSQDERWGGGSEYLSGNFEGHPWSVRCGDYDCSSSSITAWRAALKGTPYEHVLDDASYTGNIESVFVGSGLFEVKPMSFLADPGDLYLLPGHHVAMCQTQVPDILSEFSINEYGTISGGRRGDQTGREAYVHGYYDFADRIIHYNHKADSSPQPTPQPTPQTGQPLYNAFGKAGWLDTMDGLVDTGGSGDDFAGILGDPIKFIAIGGVGRYRACTRMSGWLPWVDRRDLSDFDLGCAGDGSDIIAFEIPNGAIAYQVHVIGGGWYDWMHGNLDTGGSGDTFAGDMSRAIDGVRIRLA